MTDNLFFYSSKLIWLLISPDNLFVILLFVTATLLYLGFRTATRRLLTALVSILLLLSVFPIGDWLMYPLESRFEHNPNLPKQVDGIIVLGGSVKTRMSLSWQQLELNDHGERLYSFIELAHKYPDARLVLSSGPSDLSQKGISEAKVFNLYFEGMGIKTERIQLENRARNTAENAFYTKRLVNPVENSNWILITTAFHMPRAIGVFCKNNWPVIPYPVDHQTIPDQLFDISFDLLNHAEDLKFAIHEWIGLIAYYATAKTRNLLPDNC